MKKILLKAGIAACSLASILMPRAGSAQTYCTPVNTSGNCYFFAFLYNEAGNGVTNAQDFNNNASAYTNNAGTSAGTLRRYFVARIHYAVFNPLSSTTFPNTQIKVYVDWNKDGDFDDAFENQFSTVANMTPNLSFNDYQFLYPPVNVAAGNYRMRYVVAQSGTASACGSFNGETEDFTITIGSNTAPVLNTSTVPFINDLLEDQTDNEGFSLDQLLVNNNTQLVADADDSSASSLVPRGIAITSQGASNGTWQYKIGTAAWAAIGAVSPTNALLLSTSGITRIDPKLAVRIRFLPSGPGTPTLTYRAWDRTTGTVGSYGNTTTNGGTSAFSTAQQTTGMTVRAATGGTLTNLYIGYSDTVMQHSVVDRPMGAAVQPMRLAMAAPQQRSGEVRINDAGNLLYWINNNNSLYSANTDGSGQTQLVSGLYFASGIAFGGGSLYYNDADAVTYEAKLFRANADGSNPLSLLDGAGQLVSADIGYFDKMVFYKNRLYTWYYDIVDYFPYLVSTAADGTDVKAIYNTQNGIMGFHVVNDTAFWSEYDYVTSASYIKRKALSGLGTESIIATSPTSSFTSLVADPANKRVYTLADKNIMSVDMTTGTAQRIVMLEGSPQAITAAIPSTTTALPVHVISWTATAAGSRVQLQWKTGDDEAGVVYRVERSENGIDFKQIQSIKGNRTGSYLLYDEQPLPRTSYYRLIITAPNGISTMEQIRKVTFSNQDATVVYPNPFSNSGFTVQLPAGSAFPAGYTIVDATGRIVRSGLIPDASTTISGAGLNAGQYFLKIQEKAYMLIKE